MRAIFSIFRILIFFQNQEFFLFFCAENFFIIKLKNTPCVTLYKYLWPSGYDLMLSRRRSCVRIPRTNCFYFSSRKYFSILFKFLDFLRSLDQLKVLVRVIISDFYMARIEKFTKILISRRGGPLLTS